VAGGQDYEVKYEAKKTGRSSAAVKKAVKTVGNSRKRVESKPLLLKRPAPAVHALVAGAS
jgi:hypothetical protein